MNKNFYFILTLFFSVSVFAQVPSYNIRQVTQPQNANNEPDSLGVHCRLTGTVYGINVKPAGLEFLLRDATAGIEVFASANSFNYTVQEGDSLMVQGIVAFYDGITEIQTLDSVVKIGTGTLQQPVVVTALNETTESELIRIKGLTLLSPAEWNNASGSGFDATATDGVNNYTIFIYPAVDLFNMAAPTGTFDITGIGSQHASATPYNTGYTITPRYHQDIVASATGLNTVNNFSAKIYPNPTTGQFFITLQNTLPTTIKIFDVTGKLVYVQQQNSSPLNIDMPVATKGIYIVELTNSDGNIYGKIEVAR